MKRAVTLPVRRRRDGHGSGRQGTGQAPPERQPAPVVSAGRVPSAEPRSARKSRGRQPGRGRLRQKPAQGASAPAAVAPAGDAGGPFRTRQDGGPGLPRKAEQVESGEVIDWMLETVGTEVTSGIRHVGRGGAFDGAAGSPGFFILTFSAPGILPLGSAGHCGLLTSNPVWG